jgi:hypothetical protein
MSRISDIITGVATALVAHADFTSARIYRRGELEGDDYTAGICLFIQAGNPKPNDIPYIVDFRTYPVSVVVKFEYDGRDTYATNDDVMGYKGRYSDSIKEACDDNMPGGLYPIDNVYQVDFIGEDLYYRETEQRYDEVSGRIYRVKVDFEYSTFESYDLATEDNEYLISEDNDYLETE